MLSVEEFIVFIKNAEDNKFGYPNNNTTKDNFIA